MRYDSKVDYDREEMAIINEVNTDAVEEPIHHMNAKRQRTGDMAMLAIEKNIPLVNRIYLGKYNHLSGL